MKTMPAILTLLFLLTAPFLLRAQTHPPGLDQVTLMHQVLGTWRMDVNADTIELWESTAYDKAFVIQVYRIIQGAKTILYINNIGYDETENRFKAFALWPDGSFFTWIGAFTAENRLSIDMVRQFDPHQIQFKLELIFHSPTEMSFVYYTREGEKTWVDKFHKIQ